VGDPGLDSKELRGALRALRIRRVFPRIPGLWDGRLFPAYSSQAVDSDLAHLLSLYLSKGYFDASVRLDDAAIRGGHGAGAAFLENPLLFGSRDFAARTGDPPFLRVAG
jgi:hypothetical protein